MTISFTGTRNGLTDPQWLALVAHLEAIHEHCLTPVMLVHGGCIGSDRAAHDIVREHLWGIHARIVIHPAANMPVELCDWTDADDMRTSLPPLKRNENIVDAARNGGVLLACPQYPADHPESRRSGTWYTVRFALRNRVGVVVIGSDGRMK